MKSYKWKRNAINPLPSRPPEAEEESNKVLITITKGIDKHRGLQVK